MPDHRNPYMLFIVLVSQRTITMTQDAKNDPNWDKQFNTVQTDVRPSWDDYFIKLIDTIAERATCDRGKSGCVIVKDKHILTTGYVGSPAGLPHCDEVGHQMKTVRHEDEDGRESHHCVRTIHAEQNAIMQAAKLGVSLDGSTLYCKMTPCRNCAMFIIACGIKRVVCKKDYHAGGESREMFRQVGLQFDIVDDSIEEYKNQ